MVAVDKVVADTTMVGDTVKVGGVTAGTVCVVNHVAKAIHFWLQNKKTGQKSADSNSIAKGAGKCLLITVVPESGIASAIIRAAPGEEDDNEFVGDETHDVQYHQGGPKVTFTVNAGGTITITSTEESESDVEFVDDYTMVV